MRENKFWSVLVLTLISCICGFSLAWVFSLAKDKIEENQKKSIKRAVYNLCSDCEKIEEKAIQGKIIYCLYDKKNNLIGYGFCSEGQGYQEKIKVFFVVDKDIKKLKGIEIIESKETPGLGARINEDFFKNQFKNLSIKLPIKCVKHKPSEGEIQAITSATISSKAVVNIVNEGIKELKNLLGR